MSAHNGNTSEPKKNRMSGRRRFALIAGVIVTLIIISKLTGWPMKEAPVKDWAQGRIEKENNSDYDKNMRKWTKQWERGEINDTALAAAYAHEDAIREHRGSIAKNPEQHLCEMNAAISGNVREITIPKACDNDARATVWSREGIKVIKAELLTPDGDRLATTPVFVDRDGNVIAPMEDGRWLFQNTDIYFRNDEGEGKHRVLRITVVHVVPSLATPPSQNPQTLRVSAEAE